MICTFPPSTPNFYEQNNAAYRFLTGAGFLVFGRKPRLNSSTCTYHLTRPNFLTQVAVRSEVKVTLVVHVVTCCCIRHLSYVLTLDCLRFTQCVLEKISCFSSRNESLQLVCGGGSTRPRFALNASGGRTARRCVTIV